MRKLAIICFLVLTHINYGQESTIEKGEEEYSQFSFVNTQEIYQRVADKGYVSADLYRRLGNAYYLNAKYDKSVIYHGKLIEQFPDKADSESYYRYAIALRAIKSYELSDKIMERFVELNEEDRRAKLFQESPNYLEDIARQKNTFEVVKSSINSGFSDFGPMFYKDKLIFASNRDTGTIVKRTHKWNGQPFLNLYEVDLEKAKGIAGKRDVKKFSSKINTRYHESTPVFTKDGKTVYFTRNNYTDNEYQKSNDNVNKLKIYRAKLVNEKWSEVEELPFNSDQYATAHPALSSDDKRLYFSSDMPGSFGDSDLWYVSINDDNTFGSPVNLGIDINTEGRESFPFISAEDNLYFASTGHPGLGGLDLFVTTLGATGEVAEITNLGEPVNTPQDDFGFIIDSESNSGFLSSNRDNSGLNDDIYYITRLQKPEPCEIVLNGLVKNKITGALIDGATVGLYDIDKNLIKSIMTNENADFDFNPDCDKIIILRAEKEGYTTVEKTVTTPKISAEIEEILELEEKLKETPIGVDIGKVLDLNPIYFNFDKYDIRPDAEIELAKILAYMETYPTVKIDVRSHTDSRGNDSYNMTLSENRNVSTRKWLTSRGIDSSRLTGRGYGESQLVNSCSNGVSCSKEQHQLNRRSEFILIANN